MNASIKSISNDNTCSLGFYLGLTLCVCNFVEAETHPLLMKCFPYKVSPFWRNMIIHLAKDLHEISNLENFPVRAPPSPPKHEKGRSVAGLTDHDQLSPNIPRSLEAVILHTMAQRAAMDIGCKVTHGGGNPRIESGSISQMSTQTHARRADSPIARLQPQQGRNRKRSIFIVGGNFLYIPSRSKQIIKKGKRKKKQHRGGNRMNFASKHTYFFHLPFIPSIRARAVVWEGFGTGEFVIGRWRGDDVSLTGDLTCKPCNRARHCLFATTPPPPNVN